MTSPAVGFEYIGKCFFIIVINNHEALINTNFFDEFKEESKDNSREGLAAMVSSTRASAPRPWADVI